MRSAEVVVGERVLNGSLRGRSAPRRLLLNLHDGRASGNRPDFLQAPRIRREVAVTNQV